MYQLTQNPDQVIRLEDGAFIPRGHRWWDDYEAWLSAGSRVIGSVFNYA